VCGELLIPGRSVIRHTHVKYWAGVALILLFLYIAWL